MDIIDLSMTHCMCNECNNYYWVDNNSERKDKCYKCYKKEYMRAYDKNRSEKKKKIYAENKEMILLQHKEYKLNNN